VGTSFPSEIRAGLLPLFLPEKSIAAALEKCRKKSGLFCHSAPVPLPLLPEKLSYSIKLSINNYGRN
jgi:hypothetical protein